MYPYKFFALTDLPNIEASSTRVYWPKGGEGLLTCHAQANPPVSHVTWTLNDQTLNESRRLLIKEAHLRVVGVKRSDQGKYSCNAHSSLGSSKRPKVAQVFVKGSSLESIPIFFKFLIYFVVKIFNI